jgi:hypothetical protein
VTNSPLGSCWASHGPSRLGYSQGSRALRDLQVVAVNDRNPTSRRAPHRPRSAAPRSPRRDCGVRHGAHARGRPRIRLRRLPLAPTLANRAPQLVQRITSATAGDRAGLAFQGSRDPSALLSISPRAPWSQHAKPDHGAQVQIGHEARRRRYPARRWRWASTICQPRRPQTSRIRFSS